MEKNAGESLEELWEIFLDEELIRILFSNPKDPENLKKAKVRPLYIKENLVFQLEEFTARQAFHKNLSKEEAELCFTALLQKDFRQCEIQSEKGWAQVLVSKKGKITVKKKLSREKLKEGQGALSLKRQTESGQRLTKAEQCLTEEGQIGERQKKEGQIEEKQAERAQADVLTVRWKENLADRWKKENPERQKRLQHNRTKIYVLEEGTPVPFLVDLGVMTKEGKVVRSKYDKFRQINRFLEFIQDILPYLSTDRENVIIDFGCGKSYLTFAMYHYLHQVKQYPVRIIGLDLKQEVIEHCNELSRKYGYHRLAFYHGDIASYEGVSQVDMVVTLHACDTATDYALAKAVNWGAKIILSVPCCQHEWNGQMGNPLMEPVLRYGLLKERIAALYTDGIRGEILEHMGYRTQILEFIDMEHTPKNILIRAVKQGKPKENGEEIRAIMDFWKVKPTLAELLNI